jgi:hypothetical protein
VDFYFSGGNLRMFVQSVDKQYKVDWAKVASIAPEMEQVQVPALRLSRESLERLLANPNFPGGGRRRGGGVGGGGGFGGSGGIGGNGGGGFGFAGGRVGYNGGGFTSPTDAPEEPVDPAILARLAARRAMEDSGQPAVVPRVAARRVEEERNPLEALIVLYNSLQQAKPELGELIVEGDLAKPSIVIFRPTVPAGATDLKMRAFALKGTPTNEWENLRNLMDRRLTQMALIEDLTAVSSKMRVDVQRDVGLLVVIAPESFLEAAASLWAAWQSNEAQPPQPPISDFKIKVIHLDGIAENQRESVFNLADEEIRKLAKNQAVPQGSRVVFDQRTGSIIVSGPDLVQEAADCIVATAARLNNPSPTTPEGQK